mgnify:CR=1 FL=1
MELFLIKFASLVLLALITSLFFVRPKKMKISLPSQRSGGLRIDYLLISVYSFFMIVFFSTFRDRVRFEGKFLLALIILITILSLNNLVKKADD